MSAEVARYVNNVTVPDERFDGTCDDSLDNGSSRGKTAAAAVNNFRNFIYIFFFFRKTAMRFSLPNDRSRLSILFVVVSRD